MFKPKERRSGEPVSSSVALRNTACPMSISHESEHLHVSPGVNPEEKRLVFPKKGIGSSCIITPFSQRTTWLVSRANTEGTLWRPPHKRRTLILKVGLFSCRALFSIGGTRLPGKGATTGSIIGAIIGVIILLAIIGTAIAMYRKHSNKKLNGNGPPKYKPPPPKKTNSSAARPNTNHVPEAEDRPLQDQYYNTQSAEPVTDLDAYHDEDAYVEDEGEHYYAAAPSGWDDPGNNEVPPPYMRTDSDPQDDHQGPNVSRGESFVSSAMFV
ncbi:hypothetical protein EYF80_008127 [Liparis tanakae]|uniref:Nectin-2 n=1 Tax=Liparis tanakae TaxID=230148 RepID=A0A4Z2IV28_9TELE|nr:hypothetical protein EYF80_008127 [Liparis tanakae]